MTAPVVVQGLPPGVDLRSAVLGACSDALEHKGCVAYEDQEAGEPPTFTVSLGVVTWQDGTARRVSVALQRRDQPSREPRYREIHFADADPLVERWRAVGLVIAALVGESDAPIADRQRDSILRMDPARMGWVGVYALVGPALNDGSVRAGLGASVAKQLQPLPIFLSASASYAFRPSDAERIHVRWMTLAAGGGVTTTLPRVDLGLSARIEIMLDYVSAEIEAPAANPGGGERRSLGARAGVGAVWPASGTIGLTAGIQAWMLTGGTAIYLDQRKVGSSAWLSYAGMLGAEWSFR